MTLKEAVQYLRRYQDWRTGLDIRNMQDAGITPAKLTVAFDVILAIFAEYGMDKPITDCTYCKHNYQCDDGSSRCTSEVCKYVKVKRNKTK